MGKIRDRKSARYKRNLESNKEANNLGNLKVAYWNANGLSDLSKQEEIAEAMFSEKIYIFY